MNKLYLITRFLLKMTIVQSKNASSSDHSPIYNYHSSYFRKFLQMIYLSIRTPHVLPLLSSACEYSLRNKLSGMVPTTNLSTIFATSSLTKFINTLITSYMVRMGDTANTTVSQFERKMYHFFLGIEQPSALLFSGLNELIARRRVVRVYFSNDLGDRWSFTTKTAATISQVCQYCIPRLSATPQHEQNVHAY